MGQTIFAKIFDAHRIADLSTQTIERPLTIDLPGQTVRADDGRTWPLAIEAEAKAMLVGGLDEIGRKLRRRDEIAACRVRDRAMRPWADLQGT